MTLNRKQNPSKILVGISSCLLGEMVRYDGKHSYDEAANRYLSEYFQFHSICPEIAIGMGVPRNPVQLVKTTSKVLVLGVNDKTFDVTQPLHNFGIDTATQLTSICGYIFKSRSPSCGMERVKTFTEDGSLAESDGVGAFAEEIMKAIPDLPVTDETQLQDPESRNLFIKHVYTYHRRLNT